MAWDSKQYLRFADERKQPCLDLISRLGGNFKRILDLGCGPGNSTENLCNKYSDAAIIGFDTDENMLNRARNDHPGLEFVHGYAPKDFDKLNGKFDLIFSNACIHWINNQERLIDGVCELLNDDGVFAVQIPLTDESPFYRILYKQIDEKWTKLKSIHNFHNLNQEQYYNVLIKKFKSIVMWKSDYYHVVDKEMILEWYKGSGLRPYLEMLDGNEQSEFLADLQKIINKEYTLLDDGKLFLIMPRLFFIARK